MPMASRKKSITGLSHVDTKGRVKMVDVGDKPETDRAASAGPRLRVNRETLSLRAGAVKKGDPLQIARIAGIIAAKRTADMIPLCHPLALSHVDIVITPRPGAMRWCRPCARADARASKWKRWRPSRWPRSRSTTC
jgi:molybdenum cofactor biosynthesis protein MoaC